MGEEASPKPKEAGLTKRTSFADEQGSNHHNNKSNGGKSIGNQQAQQKSPSASSIPGVGKLNSFRDEMASEIKEGSVTYALQAALPRLPIPTLQETMDKLPKVLQALQTPAEQDDTAAVVQDFMNGPGPVLQQALVDYDRQGYESGEFGSYIEEFWNESYLSPDSSVVLNLNPFFVLEGGPDPKTANDQLRRAASLCFASVKLASMLQQETLRPDVVKGQTPLCMDQFKVLFGASRQPGSHQCADSYDDVHVYGDSSHVLVLCKNQFYYFHALWPDNGNVAVDESDILGILQAISEHASNTTDPDTASQEAIGVLTSLPRSEWSKIRTELTLSEENSKSLHVIDSALFVLVLDDFEAPDVHTAAANMLHGTTRLVDKGDHFQQVGTCLNRWYDKLQLIVCADGLAGVNFEHAAIDGHTALRFVSDIVAETIISFAESITIPIYGRGSVPHVLDAIVERAALTTDDKGQPLLDIVPKKLLFSVTPSISRQIYFAETALADQMGANDTYVLEFKDFGKQFIVGNKLSPDAVVQMSILLAYYKLYGKVVCQYEPVLTKNFYHGRTEAMRSATPQARKLCEIWCNTMATNKAKVDALREATMEHSRLTKECSAGKGVDRHLFALKSIAAKRGDPVPALFQSEAWRSLNHTILSTSNCGNPSLRLFGFGPVVGDGFGVGYIIKDYGISYSVASKHRQTSRYVRTLHTVLAEIQSVLKPLSNVQVSSQRTPSIESSSESQQASKATNNHNYASGYDFYGEATAPKDGGGSSKRLSDRWVASSRSGNLSSFSSSESLATLSRFYSMVKRHESVDLNEAPHINLDLQQQSDSHLPEPSDGKP